MLTPQYFGQLQGNRTSQEPCTSTHLAGKPLTVSQRLNVQLHAEQRATALAPRMTAIDVGLNARAFTVEEPGGSVQAGQALSDALFERDGLRPRLFGHESLADRAEAPVSSTGYLRQTQPFGVVWENTLLPVLGWRSEIDVLFSPTTNAPPYPTPFGNVLFIQDMGPERGHHGRLQRLYRRAVLPRAARHADAIVTISAFCKREITALLDVDPAKIHVIHNGIRSSFHEPGGGEPVALPEPYVLFVGAMNPRKNIGALVKAFDRLKARTELPHTLVLAGPQNKFFFDDLSVADREHIRHVGFLSMPELKYAYRQASLFVFPSAYESFGLPPVEAMASGTPVIANEDETQTAFPEVLGDAALLTGTGPEELAAAIERVLTDEQLAARLTSRGAARAERYTWDRAAEELAGVVRAVARR